MPAYGRRQVKGRPYPYLMAFRKSFQAFDGLRIILGWLFPFLDDLIQLGIGLCSGHAIHGETRGLLKLPHKLNRFSFHASLTTIIPFPSEISPMGSIFRDSPCPSPKDIHHAA